MSLDSHSIDSTEISSSDVLILGGGVIGLSIAYELLRRGVSVTVLERDQFGRRASWAGAGMLPPFNPEFAIDPIEQLSALSNGLHQQWAERLKEETEIDTGYLECGAITLARTSGDRASLVAAVADLRSQGISSSALSLEELRQHAPTLRFGDPANPADLSSSEQFQSAFVAQEAQVCSPNHLRALTEACRRRGGNLIACQTNLSLTMDDNGKLIEIQSNAGRFRAENICLACGPWTEQLAAPLNRNPENPLLPMTPIRGQMLLYKLQQRIFQPIIAEGSRYLVPRADGHVLVGSTLEEAGFDGRNTQPVVERLRAFAEGLFSELNDETFLKSWAGLRPATADGMPYLGALADHPQVFIATGHFRWGIQQSTGTAVLISDLIQGKQPEIDMRLFSPNR